MNNKYLQINIMLNLIQINKIDIQPLFKLLQVNHWRHNFLCKDQLELEKHFCINVFATIIEAKARLCYILLHLEL